MTDELDQTTVSQEPFIKAIREAVNAAVTQAGTSPDTILMTVKVELLHISLADMDTSPDSDVLFFRHFALDSNKRTGFTPPVTGA